MQPLQPMQPMIDFDLEDVVLALEDVDKKIMDVEDGYTLQCNVKINNGSTNIQLNEDALLEGVMLFTICNHTMHTTANQHIQTTVKIYRDKCAILHCDITGDNDIAIIVVREILNRYYANYAIHPKKKI